MKCKRVVWLNGNNKHEHPLSQKWVRERSCDISQAETQLCSNHVEKRQGCPTLCKSYAWFYLQLFCSNASEALWEKVLFEGAERARSRELSGNVSGTSEDCEQTRRLPFDFYFSPLFLLVKDQME